MQLTGPTKTKAWIATAALVFSSVAAFAPTADAARSDDGPPERVLDQARRGNDAIQALGDRLPAVAARNDRSPAAFRADLRADDTLWVDPTGQLLFVDDHEVPATGGDPDAELTSTDVPSASGIFTLHSRPGADRVIHLDFDGHDYSGTAWGDGVAAPYSKDGDPSTFNESERAAIHSIWQRVAEDFAPFAIDVTTEDPGYAGINRSGSGDDAFGTRVVVSPTKAYNCSCGGVAYVGVYDVTGSTHDYYQPAWVFTTGVGTGAKNIAEAASHEAGHNLGLSHDDTQTASYYSGHGDWAPIMGVGYNRAISQWSRGEYAGAAQNQDDYVVMAANGAPADPDTDGGPLALGGAVSGLISTPGDVDAFTLTLTADTEVELTATPAIVSPNLDIELTLRDGATTIALDDPASSASTNPDGPAGMGATITTTLTAGTYTVEVDGVGFGDPATDGYSDWGSVGRYTLTATDLGGGTPPPEPENQAPTAAVSVDSTSDLTATFSSSASTDPDGTIVSRSWDFGDGTGSSATDPTHTYGVAGSYTVSVTVTDDNGATDTATTSVTVTDPAPDPEPPSTPTFTTLTPGPGTITISWTEDADSSVTYELEREFQHKNGQWRGGTSIAAGSTSPFVDEPGNGTFRYRIRAIGADGQTSAWSSFSTAVSPDSGGSDGGGGGGNGNGGGGGKGKPKKSVPF